MVDRVEDLRSALDAIGKDHTIGPHLDRGRLGVARGFAALVAVGVRPDPSRFFRFCRNNPEDGDCQPDEEFAATMEERAQALARPEFSADVARTREDHTIAELRAAFAIAPAWVQSFEHPRPRPHLAGRFRCCRTARDSVIRQHAAED